MTIYQNIIHGYVDSPELRFRVEQLIHRYELASVFDNHLEFLDRLVVRDSTNLSNGQKQLIHLLHLALHVEAGIILCDEPTAALDMVSQAKVLLMLRDFHQQGVTVIIATHDRRLCLEYQQVIVMTVNTNGQRQIAQQSIDDFKMTY